MDIYRNGTIIKKVHPSDSDKVTKKVMGENTLSLSFDLTSPFIFAIGDYCFFSGEKYTLNIIPKVKKSSANLFEYDLSLEGVEYELRKVQHLFYTANLNFTGGSDFSLMGNAELHARVIVENLNRVQGGWTLGNIISSDVKNLTFSSNNCLEAISKIAEEFGTEYWIGSDKTINIEKRGDILPITFEYGYKKGLYKIDRDNVNSKDVITRLYPFGSTSNLIKGYRNNAKRLQIATNYIEKNVVKYGIIESSEIFEDIKPERTGAITSVGDIFTFADTSMDFDMNAKSGENTLYLIPGTTAKIHFQTGDLAGYEFELNSYVHAAKTFKVNKFTNEVAFDLPNNTLKPRVGDKYIILDIYMPQSYVDAAEARLLARAQESIDQNSEPNVSYKCEIDPLFIKNLGLIPKQGDYVSLLDNQLGIDRDIRIVSLTRNVNNPNKIDIDLADTVEPSLESRIETTLQNQDIVIKINKLNDPARARRNYKVVQELQNAMFDSEGYFDAVHIKPLSIETSMLSVGSKWNNFYIDGLFEPNYISGVNNFKYSGGTLSHFAIDGVNTWIVLGIQETIADNNLRYIYAFCHKTEYDNSFIIISTEQLPVDSGSDYWQFLVGVLSSVIDGARIFTPTFGNTTANGRFIKTGRISSADGATWFDLDTGELQGNFKFTSGQLVQEAIDSIQVGGKNLILRSDTRLETNQYLIGNIDLSEEIVDGTELTIKALGSLADGQRLYVGCFPSTRDLAIIEKDLDGNYKATFTFSIGPTTPNDVRNKLTLYNYSSSGNLTGYINKIKLEKGNRATDWTPAPEDVAAEIATKDNTATTIAGGLITTGVIQLGNGATIKAGISGFGTSPYDIRVWAGANYEDRSSATFRVYQSGRVVAANGNINLYEDGTIELKGGQNKNNLRITVNLLETLAEILNKTYNNITITTSSPKTTSIVTGSYYQTNVIIDVNNYSIPFTLCENGFAILNITATASGSSTTASNKGGNGYVRIKRVSDGVLFYEKTFTGYGGSCYLYGEYYLEAGQYIIEAYSYVYIGTGQQNGVVLSTSISWSNLNFTLAPNNINIAANGIAAVVASNKYFYLSLLHELDYMINARGNFIFYSPNGNHALRITDNGIQKSSNASQITPTWTLL